MVDFSTLPKNVSNSSDVCLLKNRVKERQNVSVYVCACVCVSSSSHVDSGREVYHLSPMFTSPKLGSHIRKKKSELDERKEREKTLAQ